MRRRVPVRLNRRLLISRLERSRSLRSGGIGKSISLDEDEVCSVVEVDVPSVSAVKQPTSVTVEFNNSLECKKFLGLLDWRDPPHATDHVQT